MAIDLAIPRQITTAEGIGRATAALYLAYDAILRLRSARARAREMTRLRAEIGEFLRVAGEILDDLDRVEQGLDPRTLRVIT